VQYAYQKLALLCFLAVSPALLLPALVLQGWRQAHAQVLQDIRTKEETRVNECKQEQQHTSRQQALCSKPKCTE